MDWQRIGPLLHILWSAASPLLKAAALAELKALEATEANQPLLLSLIKEAEDIVAAV